MWIVNSRELQIYVNIQFLLSRHIPRTTYSRFQLRTLNYIHVTS